MEYTLLGDFMHARTCKVCYVFLSQIYCVIDDPMITLDTHVGFANLKLLPSVKKSCCLYH